MHFLAKVTFVVIAVVVIVVVVDVVAVVAVVFIVDVVDVAVERLKLSKTKKIDFLSRMFSSLPHPYNVFQIFLSRNTSFHQGSDGIKQIPL